LNSFVDKICLYDDASLIFSHPLRLDIAVLRYYHGSANEVLSASNGMDPGTYDGSKRFVIQECGRRGSLKDSWGGLCPAGRKSHGCHVGKKFNAIVRTVSPARCSTSPSGADGKTMVYASDSLVYGCCCDRFVGA
jgi:hypothetical protein